MTEVARTYVPIVSLNPIGCEASSNAQRGMLELEFVLSDTERSIGISFMGVRARLDTGTARILAEALRQASIKIDRPQPGGTR